MINVYLIHNNFLENLITPCYCMLVLMCLWFMIVMSYIILTKCWEGNTLNYSYHIMLPRLGSAICQ